MVASEVKSLANQAKQATDKIEQEIGNLNGISGDVVEALNSIKQAIQDVSEYVTSTAAAVRAAERGHERNVRRHAARRRGSRRHRAWRRSAEASVMPGHGPSITALIMPASRCLESGMTLRALASDIATPSHRPDFDHVGHEMLQQVLDAVLQRRGR